MKNLFVVSKTHLDLGFTDYAENIKARYLSEFIPSAITMAEALNKEEKRFVWTTGSWLIREALRHGTDEQKQNLLHALKKGDIAPHAMPFTTHTELLDEDTLDYGLSIVDEIDKMTGRKTIAAKMTDVPGHTIGLVHLLAKHGIQLLHIGVNGASALPDVPPCFLWKSGESEIVVIYSGDYGGEFKCDYIDDILYFDHTLDNHGATDQHAILAKIEKLKKQYPDYNVSAGRMDDYAELLWKVKEKLPVLEFEIGDTWIHGSAADPYKSAALRTLITLKNQWLAQGTLTRDSDGYKTLADNLLCTAEHTCGMDMKYYFADYENYLRKDFDAARKKDIVKCKHLFRDFPQQFASAISKTFGNYQKGSYRTIEKSWNEQRLYIHAALSDLSAAQQVQAKNELKALIPPTLVSASGEALKLHHAYSFGDWSICINEFGGIETLKHNDEIIISTNHAPALQYHSYGVKDYDYWLTHYTRNLAQTRLWAVGDFARPLLKYVDSKYRQGRFSYTLTEASIENNKIIVTLAIDQVCHKTLGAAKQAQIIYTVKADGVSIEVLWVNKPANRLTESTIFRFYPNCSHDLRFIKIGTEVDPFSIAKNGSRNISAIEKAIFNVNGETIELVNHHSPLAALGAGKILKFDNKFEDVSTNGLSFILHNNVWGTNFPLWYEDNASFKFDIQAVKQ